MGGNLRPLSKLDRLKEGKLDLNPTKSEADKARIVFPSKRRSNNCLFNLATKLSKVQLADI